MDKIATIIFWLFISQQSFGVTGARKGPIKLQTDLILRASCNSVFNRNSRTDEPNKFMLEDTSNRLGISAVSTGFVGTTSLIRLEEVRHTETKTGVIVEKVSHQLRDTATADLVVDFNQIWGGISVDKTVVKNGGAKHWTLNDSFVSADGKYVVVHVKTKNETPIIFAYSITEKELRIVGVKNQNPSYIQRSRFLSDTNLFLFEEYRNDEENANYTIWNIDNSQVKLEFIAPAYSTFEFSKDRNLMLWSRNANYHEKNNASPDFENKIFEIEDLRSLQPGMPLSNLEARGVFKGFVAAHSADLNKFIIDKKGGKAFGTKHLTDNSRLSIGVLTKQNGRFKFASHLLPGWDGISKKLAQLGETYTFRSDGDHQIQMTPQGNYVMINALLESKEGGYFSNFVGYWDLAAKIGPLQVDSSQFDTQADVELSPQNPRLDSEIPTKFKREFRAQLTESGRVYMGRAQVHQDANNYWNVFVKVMTLDSTGASGPLEHSVGRFDLWPVNGRSSGISGFEISGDGQRFALHLTKVGLRIFNYGELVRQKDKK